MEWARSSVVKSASITAEQALELNVVDLIARDLPDLLRQLDGRTVNGEALATQEAGVTEIPMITREKVFQLLWRPEVMFILMLVAIYGIIGELSNPGAILPGAVGAIALDPGALHVRHPAREHRRVRFHRPGHRVVLWRTPLRPRTGC